MKEETLKRILKSKVVAIARLRDAQMVKNVCIALSKGGVGAFEVPMTTPRAIKIIEVLAEEVGDRIMIGAGTVLDESTAVDAVRAGARFIVAPNTNEKVIRACRRYDAAVFPGAFTPTEVMNAWEMGADVVKVFSTGCVAPKYLSDLKGPYPHIKLIPSGGIKIANAVEYLKAGACAVTVGGDLMPKEALENGDYGIIEERAKTLLGNLSV